MEIGWSLLRAPCCLSDVVSFVFELEPSIVDPVLASSDMKYLSGVDNGIDNVDVTIQYLPW